MARVMGATAAASLFALVRLWTRSAWGGVFAVVFYELFSAYLYLFDLMGRWTLLSRSDGLGQRSRIDIALSAFRQKCPKQLPLGLLCGIVAGGLALTQYKSAIIFAILVAVLLPADALPNS